MYPAKVSIANNKGFESITAISRAFEVGTPAEDVVLSKHTLVPDDKRSRYIYHFRDRGFRLYGFSYALSY